ncbi:acyltransferase [Phormidium tenue FACHB-886]|nr:acyltransferase [Phormidium tenue FACHB-886]
MNWLSRGLMEPFRPGLPKSIQLDASQNSIGFIRLVLALVVIYSHTYDLSGLGYDVVKVLTADSYSAGAIAVDGFFVLSGCLITASYFRVKSFYIFLWHRGLRIFPAYWVCIALSAIALPLLFGILPDVGYFWHNLLNPALAAFQSAIGLVFPTLLGWAPDLAKVTEKIAWVKGQSTISTLFSTNPYADSINSSLWTLGHEFRLYLLIGVLGWIGLLRKEVIIGLLLITWGAYALDASHETALGSAEGLRTTTHFLMGAAFYFWTPPLNRSLILFSFVAGTLALLTQVYWLVSPLTTAYLMFWLANVLPFQGFARKRDYSYGLYIYAFPIQQALAAYGVSQWGFMAYFALSVILTTLLAIPSWHWVERLALSWKHAFSPRRLERS